jgi:hypothetical protein
VDEILILHFSFMPMVGVTKNFLIQSLNFKASQNDKTYFEITGGGTFQL